MGSYEQVTEHLTVWRLECSQVSWALPTRVCAVPEHLGLLSVLQEVLQVRHLVMHRD
jgi:hypothetical protein